MKKRIVIFDLDGTLLNTIEDLTDSTNFVLSVFNFPQKTKNQICQYIGDGLSKLIERAIPDGKNNPKFEKCLDLFKKHYKDNMFNKTKPYPNIIRMLKKIKNLGIKTAVVSNKFDDAVKILCKKYFEGLIDYCAGENEQNGIRKKPAPDAVLRILNKFGISENEAIYIGDSDVDIATAKNSNIECISVLWGVKDKKFLLENGAKTIISKPDEIYNYL